MKTYLCILVCILKSTMGIDFPPLKPILGWSSWNTFQLDVTEDIILESAQTMVAGAIAH